MAAIAGATRWDVDIDSWVAYSTALNPATEEIKLWGDDGAGGEYDTPGLVIKASLPGDIDPDRASSLLEEVDAESILGRNNKQYLFTIPEFPPEAKETLMTGITEVMKFSDREIETSMLKLAVFDKMLKDLEKKWKMKQFSNGFPAFGGGPRTGFGSSWFKTIVP